MESEDNPSTSRPATERRLARGDVDIGLRLLRAAVDELREVKFVQYHTAFLAWLAEGFTAAGQAVPGLTAIGEALTRSELTEERWAMAELLRIKGELLLLQDDPKGAVAAEEHFLQSARKPCSTRSVRKQARAALFRTIQAVLHASAEPKKRLH